MSDLPPGFVVTHQPVNPDTGLPPGFEVNAPPPGAMIHEANRSYIVGPDGNPALSVDTTGMNEDQRVQAAAGLVLRHAGALPQPRAMMPFTQGLTLGFGDEAGSAGFGLGQALKGGSFTNAYNAAQEAQKQDLAQEQADNPIRSILGQVGGGLALTPALGGVLQSGGALAPVARIATGAGVGGALGATQGFGSGSGIDDRLQQAATGGALGATVGAAAPLIEQGISSLAKRVLDQFTTGRQVSNLGLGRPAADATMRALAADNAFSGSGLQNIAAAGPEGMLVDAGPSARGALDAAMQRGGPATLVARQAVDQRGIQANRVLTNALDRTLGPPEGVEAASAAMRQGSAPARSAAYNAAYAAPIDYSHPEGTSLLSLLSRVPAKAVDKANELMQIEGSSAPPIGTSNPLPDVQQIDYMTRGLRQLAESGEDAGKLGGRTDFSRAYTNLASGIRGTLRNIVPEYGNALDTAADPISRNQALRLGQDMLKPGTGRDEVAMAVKGMAPPEIDAMKQGVRSYIDDLMANVRAAASDPNQDAREALAALRQLNTSAARQKLSTVLSSDEAGYLTRQVARAAKSAELYAGVTRNSATYGRLAVNDASNQMQAPGFLGSLAQGYPLQAQQRAVQYVFGTRPQDKLASTDEMYRQIAEFLTGRQGPDALAAMQQLTNAYQSGPQNLANARALGGNVGAAAGLGTFQGIYPLLSGRR